MGGYTSGWSEPSRTSERLGHHGAAMLNFSILAAVAVGLFPPPGLLGLTLPLALMIFVLFGWVLMRQHDRGLCEQCVREMPLDPAGRAQTLRRRFWMAHLGSQPRFLLPYFAVLIGSNFTTTSYGRWGWALAQLSLVYLVLSYTTHRKLQPWCPWCRSDGGGEKVDDPDPVVPDDDRLPT